MTFRTVNRKLACSPFTDMAVKKESVGTGPTKVGRIQSMQALTELEVLAPNDSDVPVGAKVLLRSDLFTMDWASKVHMFEGKPYILVPYDRVEGIMS